MTTISDFRERTNADVRDATLAVISENRGWFIALGILLFLTGTAAIVFPFASSVAVEIIAGISLLIAGAGQIVHSFGTQKWSGFIVTLLVGLIWLIAGGILLARPLEGLAVLTMVVAVSFVMDGTVRTIFSFRMRPQAGWGWVCFSGIIAILLGVMLLANFPVTATWTLGVLVGLNLLTAGIATLMLVNATESEAPSDTNDVAAT